MMKKLLVVALLFSIQFSISGQKTILIDGDFDDWNDIAPIFIDNTGDGQSNGIDIKNIWAHNDQYNLYFRFELTKEINLQGNNDLAIYIDYDSDINTGFKINGIGAEVRYFFGERFGVIEEGNDMEFINFYPIEMLIAPSVSSTEFEISVSRQVSESGIDFVTSPTISFRLEDNGFNGDEAPDDLTGIAYQIDQSNTAIIPEAKLDQPNSSDFRFMTYNIENDQLFDPSRRAAFERIFQATEPDIIAFQEIRDFNSTQTKDIIESFLPDQNWYHKKHGFDIVTVSKYPINFSESVDGNAAFYLDMDGQEILLINCHLPCCENNTDRQREVDIIMEYIRELKKGNGNYNVDEGTPILIAGDMNFVGDSNQPFTFRTGDIFFNSAYGPDFDPDWDDTELADADAFATNAFGNFTWLNINGSFFPGKLDWVFYTDSKLSVENSYALYTPGLSTTELTDNNLQVNDVLAASDHLPVIVDFGYSIVGVNDFVELDIGVYPNPVSNNLFIDSKKIKINTIKVLNRIGQTLISKSTISDSPNSIDVSELSSGSYYILLETNEGRIAKPFLKVK